MVDAAFAASREFHALPDAVKRALAINENNIGYLAPNESIQGASTVHKATRPNYNESFFISHDRGPDHPAIVNGRDAPRAQPVAGGARRRCGRPWSRYFKTLEAVGEQMLPVLARALDMPADWFAPYFARRGAHQPALPALSRRRRWTTTSSSARGRTPTTPSSPSWRAPRCRGWRCGLPSGEWLAPPLIAGTFLVNLGNMMKRWSNDRFLSTPARGAQRLREGPLLHRLLLQPQRGRRPSSACPSCVSADDPPRYPPAVYRDLVLAFYNANYFHRQGYAGKTAGAMP